MARLPGRLPTFGVGRRGIPDVIRLEDDEYIYLGTDNDFRIFCDSTKSFKIQMGTSDKISVTSAGIVWLHPIVGVGSRIETISSSSILRLKQTTGTGYVAIGSHSTNHSLDSNNDLLVSGELEVHGRSYFDNYVIVNGYFYVLDKQMLIFGPYGNACCIVRADSSMEQVLWSVAQNGGFQLVIGNKAYYMKDYNHPPQSNPTLFIHSATDPDTDNTEWMSLTHNQTDGVISTGKGSLKIDTGLKVKRTAVDTDYTTTESDYLIAVTDLSLIHI